MNGVLVGKFKWRQEVEITSIFFEFNYNNTLKYL